MRSRFVAEWADVRGPLTEPDSGVSRRVAWGFATVLAFALLPAPVQPQGSVSNELSGTVLRTTRLDPIEGAEVTIPALGLLAITNAGGQFRLTGIPDGEHRVRVRKVGYSLVDTSFQFSGARAVVRQIHLNPIQSLDTVVTVGQLRDPGLEDFERHRRLGVGHFYVRADIEKFTGQRISNLISQTNGVTMVYGRTGQAWVASSRGHKSMRGGSTVSPEDARDGANPSKCYVQVYLDNMILYTPQGLGGPLFDINSIPPGAIEAIEYYSGSSRIPAKYMKLNSPCGVLVIHTRR